MQYELKSNATGTKEWTDLGFRLSAYVEVGAGRLVAPAAETSASERQEWAQVSLSGLERWEAEHGLGQDDV